MNTDGGGGGGTFVYKDCSTPLIIAGGGAGGNDANHNNTAPDYIHGQITEDTERSKGVGEIGNDGGASWAGGGGAGWNSDGDGYSGYSEGGTSICSSSNPGQGGNQIQTLTNPGDGGFGGGGSNGWDVGGGGGYTGGAGAKWKDNSKWPSGGGSFNLVGSGAISSADGTNGNTGHGKVVVTLVRSPVTEQSPTFTNLLRCWEVQLWTVLQLVCIKLRPGERLEEMAFMMVVMVQNYRENLS